MNLKTSKLAYKIVLQNVIFSIFPLLLLGFFFLFYTKQTFTLFKMHEVQKELENLDNQIDKFFTAVDGDILIIRSNSIISDPGKTAAEKLVELKKLKMIFGRYIDLAILNEKGDVIASTDYDYRGLWPEKSWFQEARKGQTAFSPVHSLSDPLRNVIEYAFPIKGPKGDVYQIVAGIISMEEIQRLVREFKIQNQGEVLLLNKQGRVISSHEKNQLYEFYFSKEKRKKILHEAQGILICKEADKKKICIYYTKMNNRIKGSFWKIIAVIPYESAFRIFRYIELFVIASIVIIGTVIAFGSFYQSRKLTFPLVAFMDKVSEIKNGNLDVKMESETDDEIGFISRSFDEMVKSLKSMKRSLEEKNEILSNINQELKKQLVNSEKINLLGKISSGVSHNLKNAVFLLKHSVSQSMKENNEEKRYAMLENVENTIERIIDTIDPLLYFAKSSSKEKELVSLQAVLNDIAKIIIPYLEDNLIKLEKEYRDAPAVRIVVGEVQQAVLNVLLNAKDAYQGEGGSVLLKLYEKEEDGHLFACIDISDSGIGMSRDKLEKVFVPFYSTKGFKGKIEGIGIGLYISKIMLEVNDSFITIKSEENKGTKVTIKIPGVE